ncbi:TPA: hypothetical protein OUD13_003609 [Morganella morganii]|nr:hypothetical protein [Morganella morganii]
MDINFECIAFSGVARLSTGNVLLQVDGATLNGCVDTSEIIEEYSAEVLLEEMEDEDIIKYLTGQGYAVIEP